MLDKVLKAWECCHPFNRQCDKCPYDDECYHDEFCRDAVSDMVELLKEKQPIKPIQFEKKSKVTRDKYECGACGSSEVFKQWEYCPWCGVKLDWK